MSVEAQAWAINRRLGNPTRKLVLWGYANHAHKDGTGAWADVDTIAEYAECDRRTVQRHLAQLVAEGMMREGDQRQVQHLDPRYRPIVYDLAMDEATVEQWRAEYEAGPQGRRSRAARQGAQAGARGADVRWGDRSNGRGDNLSPLESGSRGDSPDGSGVTAGTSRGDTAVTQTVPEPSEEPSIEDQPINRAGERESVADPGARPDRLTDTLVTDPDACDADAFAGLVIRVCNRGLIDNPRVALAMDPIHHTNPHQRAKVVEWADAGAPRRVILAAVYRAAVMFDPETSERGKISSMGYFSGAVKQAAERWHAGQTAVPEAPIPGTLAAAVAEDRNAETPGASRRGGDGGALALVSETELAGISPDVQRAIDDARRIAEWLESHLLEAGAWREEETAAVLAEPAFAGSTQDSPWVRQRADDRVRQRVLNLLNHDVTAAEGAAA